MSGPRLAIRREAALAAASRLVSRHGRRARTRAFLARGAAVLLLAVTLASCEKNPSAPAPLPPRTFRLALTPFPPEPTPASFIEAMEFAGRHGDALSHHFDDGVPWDSCLLARNPPADLLEELAFRRYRTEQFNAASHVSVTFLTTGRDSVARGRAGAPRPAAIEADPSFANPAVRAALKYWCAWLADWFEPDVFSPGIEVNFYARHRPSDWPHLVSLYREIRDTLAVAHPRMVIAPTWQLDELWLHGQFGLLGDFAGEMDAIAVSLYPAAYPAPGGGRLTPATMPADYLSRARDGFGSLPMFVSETGFGDSALAAFGTAGSPQMQSDYVSWLVREGDRLGLRQITWFFTADPWGVIESVPPAERGALDYFGPMGLRTRALVEKPALGAWDAARARPHAPAGTWTAARRGTPRAALARR